MSVQSSDGAAPTLWATLGDEGYRIFFPLSALYAAIWPFMWVVALQFDLPLTRTVPASLWHAHEMLVGAFGAALIGFLTSAVPEWTDTPRLQHRALWTLASLWGIGRVVGIWGWDGAGMIGAIADLGWMLGLVGYLARISIQKWTDRLVAFVFWLMLLSALLAATRVFFALGALEHAAITLRLFGLGFLGLLGLALARITVPITNLVLDPSEQTSPFRAHPGRLNLAPGLVLVAMIGDASGLSIAASGFLYIAAGAAFLDRVAEGFVGKATFQSEVMILWLTSMLAGLGLCVVGASRLGAPISEITGLHIAFMGGLGLGVLAVFSIAGLLHSGLTLGLGRPAKLAICMLLLAVMFRVLPDVIGWAPIFGNAYILPSALWACAFLTWLVAYWPIVSRDHKKNS